MNTDEPRGRRIYEHGEQEKAWCSPRERERVHLCTTYAGAREHTPRHVRLMHGKRKSSPAFSRRWDGTKLNYVELSFGNRYFVYFFFLSVFLSLSFSLLLFFSLLLPPPPRLSISIYAFRLFKKSKSPRDSLQRDYNSESNEGKK